MGTRSRWAGLGQRVTIAQDRFLEVAELGVGVAQLGQHFAVAPLGRQVIGIGKARFEFVQLVLVTRDPTLVRRA